MSSSGALDSDYEFSTFCAYVDGGSGVGELNENNNIETIHCIRMLHVCHFLILHCSSTSMQVDVDFSESQWCLNCKCHCCGVITTLVD